METMTMWGAFAKLEALAVYAERLEMPGRVEIRDQVDAFLARPGWVKHELWMAVFAWRVMVEGFAPRTFQWLDGELFKLLDYLDLPEVQLTGAEALDALMTGAAA